MPQPTRVFLVTGAASGIGAATCLGLAAPGTAFMVHTRRNRAGAEAVAAAITAQGGQAQLALGDLADPALPAALVAQAMGHFGALDVVIANAGFADRTAVGALTDAAMGASVDAIQHAFFRLARAALPYLTNSGAGRIVAVSSFVAHLFRTDVATFPASATAKAGLEALVRALAIELGQAQVTVNAVVPGFIQKDAGAHRAIDPAALAAQAARIPLGRIGRPDDVAAAIAFLVSADAGYVTGQALHVDGGLVIRP